MNQRHLRINLKNSVKLIWHGLNTPAKIENISMSGALVRADLPVKIGEIVAMHLEDKASPDAMEMDGEVSRTILMLHNMPAFGLKFLKIPEELRMFLLRTLAKHNAIIRA